MASPKELSDEPFIDVGVSELLTPFPDVIEELQRRQEDTVLRAAVLSYLGDDLPSYFSQAPLLYMARHVATPNFETLRFLHLTESLDMQTVIGQDTSDKFVPHNTLKKALGKLSVCTGMSHKEGRFHEQFQNESIIDFNETSGKPFNTITTRWGESLVDFHNELFNSFTTQPPQIVDDAPWIDRHGRGNLLEHYKMFLALFVVHGVLFEDYLIEDKLEGVFVEEVLRPAFRFVEAHFGVRPLITQLTPTSVESEAFWLSYPRQVLDIIRERSATNSS
ncbi:MAG: hypothetical protein QG636_746 [Patescibacteria group bacterium]|jgi:hypothetical protein|nr:hypothetical protein [Patescibacteria group bacterium]